jgi:transposase-like protein
LSKQPRYPPGRGVVGPLGDVLTLADLPPSKPGRWVARRKAEVLSALIGGLLTVEDLCRKYGLTEEELLSWMRAYSRHGLPGLKANAPRQTPLPARSL